MGKYWKERKLCNHETQDIETFTHTCIVISRYLHNKILCGEIWKYIKNIRQFSWLYRNDPCTSTGNELPQENSTAVSRVEFSFGKYGLWKPCVGDNFDLRCIHSASIYFQLIELHARSSLPADKREIPVMELSSKRVRQNGFSLESETHPGKIYLKR